RHFRAIFALHPYPSPAELTLISNHLGIERQQVRSFFQNARSAGKISANKVVKMEHSFEFIQDILFASSKNADSVEKRAFADIHSRY
ncbi:hypothetical protein PMAYCL1PPCAC_27677, partial [Pristionchus mayeri]